MQNEKNITTFEKIEDLIFDGKVYAYDNRCWFTCYMTWTKVKKEEKKQVVLIEGIANGCTHYWLEVDGKILDPHYIIIECDFSVSEYTEYVKVRELNLFDAKVNRDSYEEKPSHNYKGNNRWSKVFDLGLE